MRTCAALYYAGNARVRADQLAPQRLQLFHDRIGQVYLIHVRRRALGLGRNDTPRIAHDRRAHRHTLAPAPTMTRLPSVGWRLPVSLPVPPSVTS